MTPCNKRNMCVNINSKQLSLCGATYLLVQVCSQRLAQPDCGGALALTQRGGGDAANDNCSSSSSSTGQQQHMVKIVAAHLAQSAGTPPTLRVKRICCFGCTATAALVLILTGWKQKEHFLCSQSNS
jgi:hypothetical protein